MEDENKVTLHGNMGSPYSKRVELALKLKGIPFEFVHEDLINKSPLLLNYNPVYKKVPVLVHKGKPIVESLIIIEYINETWRNGPQLLPDDAYKRAKVRFWTDFIEQQMVERLFIVVTSYGDTQKKASEEVFEKLKVLEEEMMNDIFPQGLPASLSKSNAGLLEIMICTILGAHKAQEEVVGIKLMDPEKYQLVCSWVDAINEIEEVKEIFPPHDMLVALLQHFRNLSRTT